MLSMHFHYYLHLENGGVFHLNTQGMFEQSLSKFEISPVVFERFLNFINVFSLFLQYLSLGKDVALHFN